jgi:hypothetical protein
MNHILGFDPRIYEQGINYATNIGNITKDVESFLFNILSGL